MGFLSGSVIKNPSANAEDGKTQVQSSGREDPLEEEKATQSSILAWKSPQAEKPGCLQSVGPQRARHN